MAGKVITVEGPILPQRLGITLPHEHLFVDLECWFVEPSEASLKERAYAPVTPDILDWVHRTLIYNLDNQQLLDYDLALKEVMDYKKAGGASLVDVTNIGIGRDPIALRAISYQTGLNIVCGSGHYIKASHPPEVKEQSIEELSSGIVKDVTDGIGETGIRSGIIGEIGCSIPIHPDEEKALRAAAKAAVETGAPLMVHPSSYSRTDHRILDILEEEGVDLSRVVLAHMDINLEDSLEYYISIAERGPYLEIEAFGMGWYIESLGFALPNDTDIIRFLRQLVDVGYLNQLLISQDICYKVQLLSYGGAGYAHILNNVVPMFRKECYSTKEISMLTVENPRRMLTFM